MLRDVAGINIQLICFHEILFEEGIGIIIGFFGFWNEIIYCLAGQYLDSGVAS